MIGKSLGHAVTILLLSLTAQVAANALTPTLSSTEDYHRNEDDNREIGGRYRGYDHKTIHRNLGYSSPSKGSKGKGGKGKGSSPSSPSSPSSKGSKGKASPSSPSSPSKGSKGKPSHRYGYHSKPSPSSPSSKGRPSHRYGYGNNYHRRHVGGCGRGRCARNATPRVFEAPRVFDDQFRPAVEVAPLRTNTNSNVILVPAPSPNFDGINRVVPIATTVDSRFVPGPDTNTVPATQNFRLVPITAPVNADTELVPPPNNVPANQEFVLVQVQDKAARRPGDNQRRVEGETDEEATVVQVQDKVARRPGDNQDA